MHQPKWTSHVNPSLLDVADSCIGSNQLHGVIVCIYFDSFENNTEKSVILKYYSLCNVLNHLKQQMIYHLGFTEELCKYNYIQYISCGFVHKIKMDGTPT